MQMLRDLIFIIIGTFEIITAPLNISFGLIFNDKRYVGIVYIQIII